MTGSDDWPSHTEELGRQGLTALEDHLQRHQAGKITILELFLVVSALYDTVAGLVPKDDADTIAAVHQELRFDMARMRRDGTLLKAVKRG